MKNEDKDFWCDYGEDLEQDFLNGNYPVTLNPDKLGDPYTHDFFIHLPCDLKSIKTQWKFSKEMFGISPDKAVSINEKDLRRYRDIYPNLVMIIDVAWGDVYLLPVKRALDLIKAKKAKRHEYINRKDDRAGNAKISWVFSTDDFEKIKGELRGVKGRNGWPIRVGCWWS